MFKGSRRRAVHTQPLTKETANPNAATAAASAFMRSGPNHSLSSAAAAAALRARPTTPTNVAETPSKRTRRRNTSVSSTPSRDGGRKHDLRRSSSVGSMIDRTFRSPSPGRSSVPNMPSVPPVPTIPVDEYGRSTVQTQPFHTASQKMKNGQRGSWFGAAKSQEVGQIMLSLEQRPGSVSPSINFSYPRGRTSLNTETSLSNSTLVYDANSRRMVPKVELLAIATPNEATEKPSKRKKKHGFTKRDPQPLKGNNDSGVIATSYDDSPSDYQTTQSGLAKDSAELAKMTFPRDETASTNKWAMPTNFSISLVLPQDSHQKRDDEKLVRLNEQSNDRKSSQHGNNLESQSVEDPGATVADGASNLELRSESPTGPTHVVSQVDSLVVKHEPPPRSLSPKKSALKVSASTRVVSPVPSNNGSETSSHGIDQAGKEDVSMNRKKSVRVSWDDKNTVVVGESPGRSMDSTVMSGHHTKLPFHTLGKRDGPSFDEDETMSPRPALPLFGSVRDKKAKEPEERSLVHSIESEKHSKSTVIPSPQRSNDPSLKGVDQSNDITMGIIPPLEPSLRNEANISKFREPLPILIASESSYEDGDNASVPENNHGGRKLLDAAGSVIHGSIDTLTYTTVSNIGATSLDNSATPTITVSNVDPQLQNDASSRFESGHKGVPGSFPSDEEGIDDIESDNDTRTSTTPPKDLSNEASKMDDIKEEEEEESDHNSIYSDAYEDLSETEGSAFVSLDAMLHPPAVTQLVTRLKLDDSSLGIGFNDFYPGSHPWESLESSTDWEKAKTYWRSLPSDKRRQLEKEALEDVQGGGLKHSNASVAPRRDEITSGAIHEDQIRDMYGESTDGISGVEKSYPKNTLSSAEVFPDHNSPIPQPVTVAKKSPTAKDNQRHSRPMRHSMRQSIQQDDSSSRGWNAQTKPQNNSVVGHKSGLSSNSGNTSHHDGKAIDSFSRSLQPSAPFQRLTLPMYLDEKLHGRLADDPASRLPLPAPATIRPSLRRRGSDTSESSFTRRGNNASTRNGMRISMRSSMRDTTSSDVEKGSSMFSLRSLSPTGSAFRRNSVSSMPSSGKSINKSIRQSLRHSSISTAPRSRLSDFARSSLQGKKAKSDSRFIDSSDEEEGLAVFESRFVDSSDEDLPSLSTFKGQRLAKSLHQQADPSVTGITQGNAQVPQKDMGDNGQSTVLQKESSLYQRHGTSLEFTSNGNRSGRGSLDPPMSTPSKVVGVSGAPQDTRPHYISLMSMIRRKKDTTGKISRELNESGARLDTRLERNTEQLSMIRSHSHHGRSSSWPFSEEGHGNDTGLGNGSTRQAMSQTTGTESRSPSIAETTTVNRNLATGIIQKQKSSRGTSGYDHTDDIQDTPSHQYKKKKFSGLRKIFGLQD